MRILLTGSVDHRLSDLVQPDRRRETDRHDHDAENVSAHSPSTSSLRSYRWVYGGYRLGHHIEQPPMSCAEKRIYTISKHQRPNTPPALVVVILKYPH